MIARAETPQLHFLPILNLLGVAIPPFHRHFRVRVRVDQDVERAIARVELWKEGHGGCDLAEDGLDFELDVLFGFLGGWFGCVSAFEVRERDGREGMGKGFLHWRSILLVRWLCRILEGRFLGRPVEDLDVELPSLNVFAGLLAGDYDYQFRDLAARHPFVELRHDFLDVCFDLIVGSDKHVESILFDAEGQNIRIHERRHDSFTHAVKSSAGYTPRWNLVLVRRWSIPISFHHLQYGVYRILELFDMSVVLRRRTL